MQFWRTIRKAVKYKFHEDLRTSLTSAQTSRKRKHDEEDLCTRVRVNLCSKDCCRPGSGTILIIVDGTRVNNLYFIDDPKYFHSKTKTLHIGKRNNFISVVGKNHIALREDCFESLNINQRTDTINAEIEEDSCWEEMGSEQNISIPTMCSRCVEEELVLKHSGLVYCQLLFFIYWYFVAAGLC